MTDAREKHLARALCKASGMGIDPDCLVQNLIMSPVVMTPLGEKQIIFQEAVDPLWKLWLPLAYAAIEETERFDKIRREQLTKQKANND